MLGRKTVLNLEQVVVTARATEPKVSLVTTPPPVTPVVTREESAASLQSSTARLLNDVHAELETLSAPFAVEEVRLGFAEKPGQAHVPIILRLGYPPNDDELTLLTRLMEHRLQVPSS